jgi:hypothetical protein
LVDTPFFTSIIRMSPMYQVGSDISQQMGVAKRQQKTTSR